MGQLIMWNLISLDGYFEGLQPWVLDWHEKAWGEDMEALSLDQLHSASGLVFGRKTYEGMAQYWSTAEGPIAALMNSLPKYLVSTTIKKPTWNNTQLVGTDLASEFTKLKREAKQDLYIFGSAELSQTLTKLGLIDEYRIGVAPIVLGAGNPLFKAGAGSLALELLECRPFRTGCAFLRYRPKEPETIKG